MEALLELELDDYSLFYNCHSNYLACYSVNPSHPLTYSISLLGTERYGEYLQKLRLPLEASSMEAPESAIFKALPNSDSCKSILGESLYNREAYYLDPVFHLPTLLALGHILRELVALEHPEFSVIQSRASTQGQLLYFSDSRWRFRRFFMHDDFLTFTHTEQKPAYFESIFMPSSTLVPAEAEVQQYASGNAMISLSNKIDAETEHWEQVFELLTLVIHKSLGDTVQSRAPYFIGFIPSERATPIAQKSGFYDLALMSGHLTHGTIPHMLQLLFLKLEGLQSHHLNNMTTHCWNYLLDSSNQAIWPFGVGFISATNNGLPAPVYAFHEFPTFDSPASIQRILTQRVFSTLIRSVSENASKAELDYFKSNWLKSQRSIEALINDMEVLENTLIAQQLNSWRLILKHQPTLQLEGRKHGNDLNFVQEFLSHQTQQDLISHYQDRGYTVENLDDGYILWPPESDDKESFLLEKIEQLIRNVPELSKQKNRADNHATEQQVHNTESHNISGL
ncbi:hypothetical protein [Endozoicomonas sp. OPT23]|uniref:hypothetical protein n=1 Tax=Endozoicomonas sp. OPT23 TaxID=2072845 RepID=UPI00129B5DD2|nr:hypothetical protein [Endozoicomonas sp. OPT23]